jgi:hypothetical protein
VYLRDGEEANGPEEVDSRKLKVEREEKVSGGGTRQRQGPDSRFGKLVNRMTTPPPVFCKNVILKILYCVMLQECDSKQVSCVCVLGWIDSEGFRCFVIAAGRASILGT